MALVYSPRKEAFSWIWPHTLIRHLPQSWLSWSWIVGPSPLWIAKSDKSCSSPLIHSDKCARITHVACSLFSSSHKSRRWREWRTCVVPPFGLLFVCMCAHQAAMLVKWTEIKKTFWCMIVLDEFWSVTFISLNTFVIVCLCVVQWDHISWYVPHSTITTPSTHLCSLEMGHGVVSSVSEPDLLWYVCVFGVGGRREVRLLDEGSEFLEPNPLIDGLNWVGQGLLKGGVCGWRLPSTVCRLIDPVLGGPTINTGRYTLHPPLHETVFISMFKNLCVCVCVCVPDYWSLTAEFTRGSSLSVLCLCVRVTLPQWSGSFLPLQHSKMFFSHFFILCRGSDFRKTRENCKIKVSLTSLLSLNGHSHYPSMDADLWQDSDMKR